MNDITTAIEHLARRITDEPSITRIWTVASLASALQLQVILSASTDSVEAITEVGQMWTDMVADVLEDEPGRKAETLRAARTVVGQLLNIVPAADRPHAGISH